MHSSAYFCWEFSSIIFYTWSLVLVMKMHLDDEAQNCWLNWASTEMSTHHWFFVQNRERWNNQYSYHVTHSIKDHPLPCEANKHIVGKLFQFSVGDRASLHDIKCTNQYYLRDKITNQSHLSMGVIAQFYLFGGGPNPNRNHIYFLAY